MKKEEAIKRYAPSIYTRGGEISLKALRQIAIAAGLVSPIVYKDCCDFIYINFECIDPNGESAEREVEEAYKFCSWLTKRTLKEDRIAKLKHLNSL